MPEHEEIVLAGQHVKPIQSRIDKPVVRKYPVLHA